MKHKYILIFSALGVLLGTQACSDSSDPKEIYTCQKTMCQEDRLLVCQNGFVTSQDTCPNGCDPQTAQCKNDPTESKCAFQGARCEGNTLKTCTNGNLTSRECPDGCDTQTAQCKNDPTESKCAFQGARCEGNTLKTCTNGNLTSQECPNGCQNNACASQPTKCTKNACDGKYVLTCNTATGETTKAAKPCPYTCEDGQCKNPPVAGDTCNPNTFEEYCDANAKGTTAVYCNPLTNTVQILPCSPSYRCQTLSGINGDLPLADCVLESNTCTKTGETRTACYSDFDGYGHASSITEKCYDTSDGTQKYWYHDFSTTTIQCMAGNEYADCLDAQKCDTKPKAYGVKLDAPCSEKDNPFDCCGNDVCVCDPDTNKYVLDKKCTGNTFCNIDTEFYVSCFYKDISCNEDNYGIIDDTQCEANGTNFTIDIYRCEKMIYKPGFAFEHYYTAKSYCGGDVGNYSVVTCTGTDKTSNSPCKSSQTCTYGEDKDGLSIAYCE